MGDADDDDSYGASHISTPIRVRIIRDAMMRAQRIARSAARTPRSARFTRARSAAHNNTHAAEKKTIALYRATTGEPAYAENNARNIRESTWYFSAILLMSRSPHARFPRRGTGRPKRHRISDFARRRSFFEFRY